MLLVYALMSLIAFIVNASLGVFVLHKNPRGRINQVFAVLMLTIAIWTFSEYMVRTSTSENSALFWAKIAMLGSLFIPSAVAHFSLEFSGKESIFTHYFSIILYIPPLVLSGFLGTNYIIKGVEEYRDLGFHAVFGAMLIIVILYFLTYLSYTIINLAIFYFNLETASEKEQVRYVFFGLTAPFIFGAVTNLIAPLFGLEGIRPASLFTLIAVGFVAYGIIKYNLMTIEPVTETINLSLINELCGFECETEDRCGKHQVKIKNCPIKPILEKTRKLERGLSYLIKEKNPLFSYDTFTYLISKGAQGFCLTRAHPSKIKEKYMLRRTPVLWLSKLHTEENVMLPTNLTGMMMMLQKYLEEGEDVVIIIDGIEYLISQNGYKAVLKFIQGLNEKVMTSNARLIIPLNPDALDSKEVTILSREMEVIDTKAIAPKGTVVGKISKT